MNALRTPARRLLFAGIAAAVLFHAGPALGYGSVTHGRLAAETYDRLKPALEAKLGPLGNKAGGRAEMRDYYRYRNAFCYGAMGPDVQQVTGVLADPAARARLAQAIADIDARRVGGFPTGLSVAEIAPFPAATHDLDFALHYLLDEALKLPGPDPRCEAVLFSIGWALHIVMDKFADALSMPYQVADSSVGELGLPMPGATAADNLYPLYQLEGLGDIFTDLAFDPAMIEPGEWADAIRSFFLAPGFPPFEPVPIRSDTVVNIDLPALFRTALARWTARHGGTVPSAVGIRNAFRLYTLAVGLCDALFSNWSSVLEGRSKWYFGTAEFNVTRILGRNLNFRCKDGEFQIIFDLPGPWNIVKGIPADRLKLALRRLIEAYRDGMTVATLLYEGELPSFGVAGLGIAEVRFSLLVSFAEPELRVNVRVTLFGGGPTVYTAHIPLPRDVAQHFTDPQGKTFALIGLGLYPDLDLDPLFRGHLEYQIGRREGFIAYPRYRAFWAGSRPLGRPDAVAFTQAAGETIAWNLASGNYSGDLWLDDQAWPYGGLGERVSAATQSHIRFARGAGALGPGIAPHPEVLVHSVVYRRDGQAIAELPDAGARPVAVEVEFLSPLYEPPAVAREIILRIRRSAPWAAGGRGAVVAERVEPVNLYALGVRERLRVAAGARLSLSTAFTPAARDAGYLVELALRDGSAEETFFTTDVGLFRRAAIEDVTVNGARGRRERADAVYAAFPAWNDSSALGRLLRGLRFARGPAFARPAPVGGEGPGVGFAAESAGWDDMAYAKLRAGGRIERVTSRGLVTLVQRASGATELSAFDTYGDPAAEGRLFVYLEALEPGATVALAVCDEASRLLSRKADLAALLASPSVTALGFRDSLAVISRKLRGGGGPGAFERLAEDRSHARDGLAAARVAAVRPPVAAID